MVSLFKKTIRCLFSFGSIFMIGSATAQYTELYKSFKPGYCNVCRDVPGESDPKQPVRFRYITNGNKEFDINGKTWTCQYLQDTVQDVNPYNGAPGEGRWCGLAQTFAEQECDCAGPTIPSMNDYVKDINQACDLCEGMQFDYVPTVNAKLTANTGVAGSMNCLGLYNAMSKGVLSNNLCPTVVQNAGPVCCSLESIAIEQQHQQQQQQRQCAGPAQVCATNNDCCKGLSCTTKVLGRPKSCSSSRTRQRASIASGKIGGAAGRYRNKAF